MCLSYRHETVGSSPGSSQQHALSIILAAWQLHFLDSATLQAILTYIQALLLK